MGVGALVAVRDVVRALLLGCHLLSGRATVTAGWSKVQGCRLARTFSKSFREPQTLLGGLLPTLYLSEGLTTRRGRVSQGAITLLAIQWVDTLQDPKGAGAHQAALAAAPTRLPCRDVFHPEGSSATPAQPLEISP